MPLNNTYLQISKQNPQGYISFRCYGLVGRVTAPTNQLPTVSLILVLEKLWTLNETNIGMENDSRPAHHRWVNITCLSTQFTSLTPTPLFHYILLSQKHGRQLCYSMVFSHFQKILTVHIFYLRQPFHLTFYNQM